jgi:multidrug resistance efflux pump
MELLFQEGAISRQQVDRARADLEASAARREEMAQALRRAEEGTPREELDQAREAHRQAQAALDLLLAGSRPEDIEAAAAEAAVARNNLQLLLRGTRPEEIRAAEARLAQARAVLEELRAGSRRERIAQARAAARAAAATAQGSRETLEERVVRAPRDGVVERLLIAAGDLVAPGTPVVRIADPTDLWLRVYVPESSLASVSVGAGAELRIDGIAEPVAAVVESIATRGEFTPANLQTPEERGKQVFGVRLRLQRPDPRVKAGMYATVRRIGGLGIGGHRAQRGPAMGLRPWVLGLGPWVLGLGCWGIGVLGVGRREPPSSGASDDVGPPVGQTTSVLQ